jgi:hypothetical protein
MESSDNKLQSTSRVRRLDELPQDVQPIRDLWPTIAAAIEATKKSPVAAAPSRAHLWSLSWMTWAACASLALLTVGVILVQHDPLHSNGAEMAAVQAALGDDADYTAGRAALAAAMPSRIAALPTEAQAGVAAGLAAIHEAEAELQQAIKSDPGDPLLLEMLIATRQEEMRVMTSVQGAETEERLL